MYFLTHLRILRSYAHYYQKQFSFSVNFLFDNKTLSLTSKSVFKSLWILTEMTVIGNLKYLYSRYLKSGYLSFGLEGTLKKELVIQNVKAICWIVPKKCLLLLDQAILLQFRSSIDRPLSLPQYPESNNYFSIPEENI